MPAILALIARAAISAGAKRLLTKELLAKRITPAVAKSVLNKAKAEKISSKEIKELMRPKGSIYRKPQRPSNVSQKPPKETGVDTKKVTVKQTKPTGKKQVDFRTELQRDIARRKIEIKREVEKAKAKKKPSNPERDRIAAKASLKRERRKMREQRKKEEKKQRKEEREQKEFLKKPEAEKRKASLEYGMKEADKASRSSGKSRIEADEKARVKDVGEVVKPTPAQPLTKDIYVFMRDPISGKRLIGKSGKPLVFKLKINTNKGQTEELIRLSNEIYKREGIEAGKRIGNLYKPVTTKVTLKSGKEKDFITGQKKWTPNQWRRAANRVIEEETTKSFKKTPIKTELQKLAKEEADSQQVAVSTARAADKATATTKLDKVDVNQQLEMLKRNLFQIQKQLNKPAGRQSQSKIESLLKEKETIQKNISSLEKRNKMVGAKGN